MNDVTQILNAIERGDRQAAGELLPLIYDQLRKLAAQKLAHESSGQTLQATALVHEAYVRLVDDGDAQCWDNRSHFFAAATGELLSLVYDELRKLAAHKLMLEAPGQTLQPTALVHEAWLRLAGNENQNWNGRAHFFGAAAEAMRRILIENARRKLRIKHGGEFERVEFPNDIAATNDHPERLIELDAALTKLAEEDATAAEVVKLHFFAGQSLEDVAKLPGISRATAYRQWSYARSWLK